MSVTAKLQARFGFLQVGSHDLGGPELDATLEKILNFTNGTGANEADIVWADRRTIAASTSEDLDLAGVLTDAFGATINAAEVVAILVIAAAANTNNVVLGGAAAPVPLFGGDGATAVDDPTFAVKPGGFFFVAAPNAAGLFTVGAGTTDDLKVANSGGTTGVTYDIAILARSA